MNPVSVVSGLDPGTEVASIDSHGNAQFDGTLQVDGAATVGGALAVGGALTVAGQAVTPGGGGSDATYPLAGYGLLGASGDPMQFMGVSAIGNNLIFYPRVWVPANKAIGSLWCAVRDAGTWDGATGPNGIALYDDTGTYVDVTNTTGTMWTANGWVGGALTLGTVAAQASGRFVYLAVLQRGMTASPNMPLPSSASDAQSPWFDFGVGVTKRRCMYNAGTSFPASFNPASTGTATCSVPLVGFS